MIRALLLLLVLTGCATSPTAPAVQVKIPVPVSCVTESPQKPAWVVDMLQTNADILTMTRALRRDRLRAKAYMEQLLAILEACK